MDEARRTSAEMFAMAPPGPPVGKVEDLRVPVAGSDIPVRVYVPEGEGPFPVMVLFHGGGWVVGDVDAQDADCRTIANGARCMVVSVDYRLAPENKFPVPAEDAYAATLWVAENSARLGGDGKPVAVGGMSAGGNLAAVVALRDEGRAYADRLKAAGVPVTYTCYEGAIHMALGPEALDDAAAFLREHLL